MTGRRPQGQGTRGDKKPEQETTNRPGRERTRDRGAEGEDVTAATRAYTQEGHATTQGPAPHHPPRTSRDPRRRTPTKTCRRSTDLTPYGPHRLTPTGHQNLHRGRRAHPHGEKGLHPPREPLRTPRSSPPPCPHCQKTTQATARATI